MSGPPPFLIRPATEADLPAAMALFEQLHDLQKEWRVFAPRPDFREEMAAWYRRASDDPDALHLVAEVEGSVAGMALGHVHRPSSASDERALEVSSVFVEPAARRRGVGRALVRELAAFAAARGVAYVTLKTFAMNESTLRYWRELGFSPRMVQLVARVPELEG